VAYTVKANEIAFIIRPVTFDKENKWSGDISTAIAMHEDSNLEADDISYLVDLVTLLSAFIDVIQYDEYVYDTVDERRTEMIELEFGKTPPIYEEVEGTDGKVIKLTIHTKTEGNA